MEELNRIKLARQKSGYSQTELVEMLGVTPGAVSQWEVGKTSPSLKQIKPLAEILNMTVEKGLEIVQKAR